MTAVPAVMPVTIPEAEPTVALAEPDVHVPPPEFVRVVVPPTHTVGVPPLAPGGLLTVTESVEKQPFTNV